MIPRQNPHQLRQQPLPQEDAAMLASLVSLIQEMPELPADTLQVALRLLAQLPSAARRHVSQLIAGKVSYDFAMRFLVALSNALTVTAEAPAIFDMRNPVDQRAITRLLTQWTKIITPLRIPDMEALRQCLVSAIGLQIMMEAAPAEAQRSWIFDAGAQYQAALQDVAQYVASSSAVS
jgi:hypothetical protein